MKTEYISKSETSINKMHEILEIIQDSQQIHAEERVMPGMGLFYLISPYIKKPILKVTLEFKGLRLYPFDFRCSIIEESEITTLNLEDKIGIFGEFKIFNGAVSGDNLDKIKKVYKTGGKMLESFKGHEALSENQAVLYMSQSMKFNDEDSTPYDQLRFKTPEMLDKRNVLVRSSYFNSDNKETGYGESKVTIIPKKIWDKIIEQTRKHQA